MELVSENDFPEEDIDHLKKRRCCLASAVAYIHSQNIRHKDIKPSNAICKGDEIFLTNFGSAHQFSAGLTSATEGYAAGVTRMYSAPEVIEEDKRGRSADIFSLGCVFAEMTTVIQDRRVEDFHDFRSEPDLDDPEQMTLCYFATAHKVKDWFASDKKSAAYALICSMMVKDQKGRSTAEQVMSGVMDPELPPMNMICTCLFNEFVQRGDRSLSQYLDQ
jgi:serine/threonine protein kinase